MSMAFSRLVRSSRSNDSPHYQRPDRVLDLLAGTPLPGTDQRVPGLFPHVGEVHGVEITGYPAREPQVLAFHARSRVLPACSRGSARAKHGRSSVSSSARFRSASAAPI